MAKTQKVKKPTGAQNVEMTICSLDDVMFELTHPNYRETTVFRSVEGDLEVTSKWTASGPVIYFDKKWIHDGAQLLRKLTGINWVLAQ